MDRILHLVPFSFPNFTPFSQTLHRTRPTHPVRLPQPGVAYGPAVRLMCAYV